MLNNLLEFGVTTIPEFWEMTMGEIIMLLKATQKRLNAERVNKLQYNYELAKNTAIFAGLVINGSGDKIPEFGKLYPYAIKETETEENRQNRIALYREQMRSFAREYNERRAKKLAQEANNG